MIKRYSMLFVMVALAFITKAQVNYNFSSATGTYASIAGTGTNPTLVSPDASYTTTDEGYANAVPIGFNFIYNGITYTSVNINANGYLTLGAPFIADANESYYYDSLAGGPVSLPAGRPVIAPFWADMDLQAETNLTYTVTGTAPNRVFIVEWANALWDYTATTASISFQAQLHEGTNVIDFIYNQESGTPSGGKAGIGLTATGIGSGNFLSLGDVSGAPAVSTTVETALFDRPATGQIYRFTPLSCIPPVNLQLTNVTLTSATISWTAAAGASGYQYIVTNTNTPPTGAGTPTTATSVNLTGLAAGVNYVYVRTNCGGTYSLWTVKAIVPCTTNVSPANGTTNVPVPPTISWTAVPGATGYAIMFSLDGITYTNLGSLDNTFTSVAIPGTTANTTYYFYVRPEGGSDTASESCASNATSFTTQGGPANDSICNAIPLILNGGYDCQNTEPAGVEAIEPAFGCSTPNNTVWYTYTPVTSGPVNIIFHTNPAATTNLDVRLGYFTATGSCPNIALTETFTTLCSEADLTVNDSVIITSASLVAGTTYYILVDGVLGAMGGYCIRLEDVPAAPACTVLLSPADNATNVAAPTTPLSWTSVPGATGYTVYFGTTNPPTTALGSTPNTSVNITGVAFSTTYYWSIVPTVSGIPATGCSVFSFTTMAAPAAPANDDCTGAIGLAAGVPVPGTTISATESLPANACNGFTGDANDDVWYTVTALYNGDATVTVTPDGNFDAVMEAFTGSCGSLTSIACADDSIGGESETLLLPGLTAGQVVYIRVFDYDPAGSEGTYTIQANGSALPVRLVSFKGERAGSKNALYWSTASEQNNRGFELQRSADGENFSTLTFVASKAVNGNSSNTLSYQYNDEKPFAGNSYYRLKQVDIDGKSTFSNVILIKGVRANSITMSAVYPNPVKETLKVILSAPATDVVKLVVTDLAGKIVIQQAAEVLPGDNHLSVNVLKLPSGSYMIKTVCANGCETTVSKFVKQ